MRASRQQRHTKVRFVAVVIGLGLALSLAADAQPVPAEFSEAYAAGQDAFAIKTPTSVRMKQVASGNVKSPVGRNARPSSPSKVTSR